MFMGDTHLSTGTIKFLVNISCCTVFISPIHNFSQAYPSNAMQNLGLQKFPDIRMMLNITILNSLKESDYDSLKDYEKRSVYAYQIIPSTQIIIEAGLRMYVPHLKTVNTNR